MCVQVIQRGNAVIVFREASGETQSWVLSSTFRYTNMLARVVVSGEEVEIATPLDIRPSYLIMSQYHDACARGMVIDMSFVKVHWGNYKRKLDVVFINERFKL